MSTHINFALILLSNALIALAMPASASAACRVGQTTRIVESHYLSFEFCGGAVGTNTYECRPLNRGTSFQIVDMCNKATGKYLFACQNPGSIRVKMAGGYIPDEQRDSNGVLIGCGIKLMPALTGDLKVNVVSSGGNFSQTILECENN